jgi:translation elongation factor EF-4
MDKKHNIRNISVIAHVDHGGGCPDYLAMQFFCAL